MLRATVRSEHGPAGGRRGAERTAADGPDRGARRAMPQGKRMLDLVVAVPALIVAAPVLLLAAALVRLTSPGPALFRQTRIGLNGRPFTMFKLRTMRLGADDRAQRE